MKLLKLTVENFRVFHGRHVLDLDVRDDKPVVLILGMNGAGKTTLLSAFAWALYGTFTKDVERQERIINDRVWNETQLDLPVAASVKLEFEHDGAVFTVHRQAAVTKDAPEQNLTGPWPVLVTENQHGESKKIENGQDRIEKILPAGLRQFFFFNGERVEQMFAGDGNSDVRGAIKTLLGLEIIERAITDHLPEASRRLTNEARKLGDSRLGPLAEKREKLEKLKADAEFRAQQLSRDIASYQHEAEEAGRALMENKHAAPLQERRVQLDQERRAEKIRRKDLRERKQRILGERGFIAFTAGIDRAVITLADDMRSRHQLPAGVQRDFIDGLIEDGKCMCDTPVPPGSAGHAALSERRHGAGLVDVQVRWMNLRGDAARLTDARETLRADLRGIAADIRDAEERIDRIDAESSDIDRKLKDVDVSDVQRLEQRRSEYEGKRYAASDNLQETTKEIERLDEEIVKQRRAFHAAELRDNEAQRVQRQVSLVDEVLEAFERILNLKTEEIRTELDTKVKNVFSRICIKPFTPELTASFDLQIHADTTGPAAIRSTGENQILGLSFVGAVADMAFEIHNRRQSPGGDTFEGGGIYPVVMDAPFGNLDIEYQNQVAEALPRLTTQIVTMLSQSQARGQVMERLQAAATRVYVLRSVTSKPDAKEQTVTISGRAVPYVTRGDFEHTVLEEVTL
ncbi:AAA family ATPase [Embleya scabrispora]|uniref:AAA family ATPase n=1 Tax=Embleya scabrispora TaxID=159449 RepID=UPI000366FCAD|nr:AAA family ATPase [Embleya scabrispora]MYS87877.1 AAA family ATPase [Streptomyces sp. SID5474]